MAKSPLDIMNTMGKAAHIKAQKPKPHKDAAEEAAEEEISPGIHKKVGPAASDAEMEDKEEAISPGIHKKVSQKQAGAIASKKKGK